MDADADVEDMGFDAKRIDDVVAAYDAVEDHEDHAEDYFYDLSGNEENNIEMVKLRTRLAMMMM
jgi:hypothetical protein